MARYSIDIDLDDLNEIVYQELKLDLKYFKEDFKREKPNVFDTDPVKDKKKIKEHIEALKLIIKYHEVPRA